jgi:hypothetical protein
MSSLAVFALIAIGVLASIDLLAVFVSGNLLGWMSQVRVRHANGTHHQRKSSPCSRTKPTSGQIECQARLFQTPLIL